MIGYVLLIAIAIIMSMIVFQFIRTYVPKDAFQCPDGVSVFIQEAKYVCGDTNTLEVTTKNNGRFNIAGYFIHATTSLDQELATEDLSGKIPLLGGGGEQYGNSIVFTPNSNSNPPNEIKTVTFDLTLDPAVDDIYKIEIIPVRFQEEEGKTRFVSCGDAKVSEVLSCYEAPEVCEPDCDGRVCGDDGCSPYGVTDCGSICSEPGEICNLEGLCVECTPDCSSCASNTCVGETCTEETCNSPCEGTLEPDCGTRVCGPAPNGCGDVEYCGTCDPDTEECTPLGQCEILCGNSGLDDGEECDDGDVDSGDGCSNICIIEAGWECDDEEPSNCEVDLEYTCANYCQDLFYDFGQCTSNTGQCTQIPGEVMGQGTDYWCTGDDYCCCFYLS